MTAFLSTLRELEAIVGETNLLTATQAVGEHQVEGQTPLAVARPGSADEVAALLKAASTAGLSVLIRGAGHHLHLGAPPGPIGLVLCLDRLDQIVEYDAGDLTITAQAGVALDALQRVVAENGQMLALDPPGPDSATLGGIAATNLSGPMRMRCGAPRDLVIGLQVALTRGSVVKTGGRTVKNVAGYDLNKLFVGSMGTLGAICEVTVRLAPLPEARAMVMAALPPARAAEVAATVAGSWLEAASLDLVTHAAVKRMRLGLPVTSEEGAWVVLVGLTGDGPAIARQEREIRGLAGSGCARVDGNEADQVWQRLRDAAHPRAPRAVLARSSVPMAAVHAVLDLVSSWEGWWAVARAAEGVVYAGPGQAEELPQTKQRLSALRHHAEERGGFAVLQSGPVELKREFPVWGENTGNLDLMRDLKQAYDPAGVLGCGRFPHGH